MILFHCPACGKKVKAPPELALTASPCPTCGVMLAVPSPGINRTSFILLKILQVTGLSMLAAIMGEARILLVPVAVGASIWLAIPRLDNIGMKRWWGALALIPWIFTIYLACAAPGSGRRRSRNVAIPTSD
jgi:hypothetical protein